MSNLIQARKIHNQIAEEFEMAEPDYVVQDVMPPKRSLSKDNQWYTVLKGGERLFDVSRKLGIPEQELIEHNDLDELTDTYNLPEFFELHLPYPPTKTKDGVIYEILPYPTDMHISKEDGARKWSFGNVTKWEHIMPSGPTYPMGTNVKVYALAHVPVEGETASYYIDQLSLGNYHQTGRVSYMTGYNHTHLSEGIAEPIVKQPRPEIQEAIEKASYNQMLEQIAADAALQDAIKPDEPFTVEQPEDFSAWKETYVPLHPDRHPEMFTFNGPTIIRDLETRHRDVEIKGNPEVLIEGTFYKDGNQYYRPKDSVQRFNWYGIPVDSVTSNYELYNPNIPLIERVVMNGQLSTQERYVTVPLSKLAAKYEKIRSYIDQRIHK